MPAHTVVETGHAVHIAHNRHHVDLDSPVSPDRLEPVDVARRLVVEVRTVILFGKKQKSGRRREVVGELYIPHIQRLPVHIASPDVSIERNSNWSVVFDDIIRYPLCCLKVEAELMGGAGVKHGESSVPGCDPRTEKEVRVVVTFDFDACPHFQAIRGLRDIPRIDARPPVCGRDAFDNRIARNQLLSDSQLRGGFA